MFRMQNSKYTTSCIVGLAIIAVLGAVFLLRTPATETKNSVAAVNSYKNISYVVNGQRVQLTNGMAETETAPGSASKIITKYFGNELKTDLDGDDDEDIVFILTQSTGGSGTFYYAVAALNTPDGYVGSDGYLLGDRIAPQSTTISPDASQKYVVVFNYADRADGEPMTTPPSVGKSVYLKLNPDTLQWAIVLSPEEQRSL